MRKMILPSIMMALIMMLPFGAMSQSGIENYVSASGCVVYHAPVYHTGTDGYVFDFEADYDAEHLLECTVMDADGDGNNWSLSPVGEGFGHNGSNGMLMSYSYNNVTQTALSPNNFLVLPQITITANNKMLTFLPAPWMTNIRLTILVWQSQLLQTMSRLLSPCCRSGR